MTALMVMTCFLIIFSKFLDCLTTQRGINHASQERNPVARWLMGRFGIRIVIWGIFCLVVIASGLCLQIALTSHSILIQGSFIGGGLVASFAQGAVAHANHTGRFNFFVRILLKIYR